MHYLSIQRPFSSILENTDITVHGRFDTTVHVVTRDGRSLSNDQHSTLNEAIEGTRQNPLAMQWKPPENGKLKINFDLSFTGPNNIAGIGLILRDCAGICKGARGVQCYVSSVDEGEALAASEARKWVEELSIVNWVLEGDSSNVIGFLKGNIAVQDMDWRAVNILSSFTSLDNLTNQDHFVKVARVANKSADALAKVAKLWDHRVTWEEHEIPCFLFYFLNADCNAAMGAHPDLS